MKDTVLVETNYCIDCIKEKVLELLLLKQIFKILVVVGVFSQRIKDKDDAEVNYNYKKNPVETVYMLIKIRTK